MTHENVISMLRETGLPVAYDHFAEGEAPDPPFLCFLYPNSDDFAADGRVFQRIDDIHIELYTDKKDTRAELIVEAVLDAHEIPYRKSEVWIEKENLYEVLYSTQILRTDTIGDDPNE